MNEFTCERCGNLAERINGLYPSCRCGNQSFTGSLGGTRLGATLDAEELLPHAYLLEKLAKVMPLFQEARDALTAITEQQRRLRGISPTLADRMDEAGTFSVDNWRKTPNARLTGRPLAGPG